jgi:hypothetical protein
VEVGRYVRRLRPVRRPAQYEAEPEMPGTSLKPVLESNPEPGPEVSVEGGGAAAAGGGNEVGCEGRFR